MGSSFKLLIFSSGFFSQRLVKGCELGKKVLVEIKKGCSFALPIAKSGLGTRLAQPVKIFESLEATARMIFCDGGHTKH